MHILVISSKFPFPLKDGGAIATYALAKGLSETGNEVFLFSFNTRKHFIEQSEIPDSKFKDIHYQLIEIDTHPNFFKAFINLLFSKYPYILQRFKSKNFSNSLIQLLQQQHFDIIQIEGLYMMQYLQLIRTNSKALVAYRPHNLEHKIWNLLSDNNTNWFKKLYFKNLSSRIFRYEKKNLNKYDVILPISPFDATFFEKLGNSKTLAVVPAGFDIDGYTFQNQVISKHKLYYIGSLEWLPNQEAIIWFINNCWDRLKQHFPALELHIAGRNTPKWIISENQHPGLVWAGEVDDVQEFVKDKTIMIVPLFSGSGMRVKIIEAFLNSKAVVASGVAIEGISAADNCELLIADGHIDFITKIGTLIRNKKLYSELTKNSFAFACNNFDNKQISSDLSELYRNLVKPGKL